MRTKIMNKQSRRIRKMLRNNPTPHEQLLWKFLKGSQRGLKFRRQHGIGSYIVDFYAASLKLIIELDGEPHIHNKEYDQMRETYLASQGCTVLRFWNGELKNIDLVLKKIDKYILHLKNHPQPPS